MLKKYKIASSILATIILISPSLVSASVTLLDQTIASSTDQTSSSMVLGAGTSPLTGQGTWTNPIHDTLYDGIAGSAWFTLTDDIDIEGGGGIFGARISGSSTAIYTGQTAGVYGSLSGVKAMPGATGHAVQINGVLSVITNASPTFNMNKVANYTASNVQGPGGNVDNQIGYWCKNKFNYGTISNTCLSIMTDKPPAGNWSIYDNSNYASHWTGIMGLDSSAFSLASDGSQSFFKVSGTTPTSTSATIKGIDYQITAASSSALQIVGAGLSLLDGGYTSSGPTIGLSFGNSAKGTGNNYFTESGNIGIGGITNGSAPTAHNVGGWFNARNGAANVGVVGRAIVSTSGGLNLGTTGFANNSSGNAVGGYFGLNSSVPTISESAALIADNGSVSAPIFLARKNGITKVAIDSNGNLCLGSTCINETQLQALLQLLN